MKKLFFVRIVLCLLLNEGSRVKAHLCNRCPADATTWGALISCFIKWLLANQKQELKCVSSRNGIKWPLGAFSLAEKKRALALGRGDTGRAPGRTRQLAALQYG